MSTDLLKNVGKGINLEKVSLGKDDNEEAVPLSQLGRPRHKMTCNHR